MFLLNLGTLFLLNVINFIYAFVDCGVFDPVNFGISVVWNDFLCFCWNSIL